MCDNFTHLHVHTEYSLLDGYGSPSKTVSRAVELGQSAMAITDHGYMFGVIEFYRECIEQGVKPILGVELYSVPFGSSIENKTSRNAYHILILARNDIGYRNLIKLDSIAATDGFYYNPRIDSSLLLRYKEGLILTSGCMASETSRLIQDGKINEARQLLIWYRDNFEYFYIEIQVHAIPELIAQNRVLFEFAKELNIPMVVTNDAHYPTKEDAPLQDIMLCIQTHSTITDVNRMSMSDNGYYVKSRQEMFDILRANYTDAEITYDEINAALDNTNHVADLVSYSEIEAGGRYFLPDIEIPSGYTYDTYLRELVYARLDIYYDNTPEVIQRVEEELDVIAQTGFAVYFLIIRDICEYARSQNIIWNVRGSGAGSVVSYVLGLSFVEPMKNGLMMERFLGVTPYQTIASISGAIGI